MRSPSIRSMSTTPVVTPTRGSTFTLPPQPPFVPFGSNRPTPGQIPSPRRGGPFRHPSGPIMEDPPTPSPGPRPNAKTSAGLGSKRPRSESPASASRSSQRRRTTSPSPSQRNNPEEGEGGSQRRSGPSPGRSSGPPPPPSPPDDDEEGDDNDGDDEDDSGEEMTVKRQKNQLRKFSDIEPDAVKTYVCDPSCLFIYILRTS